METNVPCLKTWLIRHGQSTSNAGLPTHGHSDVALTQLGFAQAREVASQVEQQPDLLVDSPFLRARATADAIQARWPNVSRATWPIQEVTYLSPARCIGSTVQTRQPLVDAYWGRCDPDYIDGVDAESFAQFMQRIRGFHARLLELNVDFLVVVGHGQFFAAYRFALANGFVATPDWMRRYRATESAHPLRNGEIVELNADAFSTPVATTRGTALSDD
jgi:broad specificity phosphatase PhoE